MIPLFEFLLAIVIPLSTFVLAEALGTFGLGRIGTFVAMTGGLVSMLLTAIIQVDGTLLWQSTYDPNTAAYVNQTGATYPLILVPLILVVLNFVAMVTIRYD